MNTNSCFISYRRANSAFFARAVFQDLRAHEIDAFLDVESIDQGDFREAINAQIRARPYFLPILSPGALDRCKEPGDILRGEFEIAVAGSRRIVPLMSTDFDRKEISRFLPPALETSFLALNSVNVDHEYFPAAMEKLRTRFLKPLELSGPHVDPELARTTEVLLSRAMAQPSTGPTVLRAQKHIERALAFAADAPTLVPAEFEQASDLLQQAAQPKRLMHDFDLAYLELQQRLQRENAQFTLVSNLLKAKHDAAMSAILNIR